MRKIFSTVCAIVCLMLCVSACTQTVKSDNNKNMEDNKILVAYFSRTGENYSVGNISKGNTHIIADMIASETGGDIFEITPVKAYPEAYDPCVEIARNEKESNARPEIRNDIRTEDFDIIFIGYPIWWDDMPMPVHTFIDKHDWNGKTVIPFCTHEGSGLGDTQRILRDACKGATVLSGLAVRGNTAQNKREEARTSVNQWLNKIKGSL